MLGQVVQVPRVLLVQFLIRVQVFLALLSECRAKLTSLDVSRIFDFDWVPSLVVDDLPEVFFQFLIVLGRLL